jgi:hypothetical protein
MTISIRSSATSSQVTGNSPVVNLPATIVAGDELFMWVGMDGGSGTVSASGWTSLRTGTGLESFALLHRTADGTEGSTVTLSTSNPWATSTITIAVENAVSWTSSTISIATGRTRTTLPLNGTGTAKHALFVGCYACGGNADSSLYHMIDVPTGATQLEVTSSGNAPAIMMQITPTSSTEEGVYWGGQSQVNWNAITACGLLIEGITSIQLAANEVRPTALVGHWSASLDDDGAGTTTATDLSGNGHNGTKNGGLTEVSDPSFNGVRAWDMDGTGDYITVADDDAFTFVSGGVDQPFTISTWVRFNAINSGVVEGVVTKGDAADTGEWQITKFNTDLYWRTTDQSGGVYFGIGVFNAIIIGKWTHFACTYDGRTGNADAYKIYLDGVEVPADATSSNGTPSAMQNTTHPVLIGRRGTSTELDGRVDDTRIYNAVLSVDEIQALAASRVGREPLTDQNWKDVLDGMTQWIDGTVWYSLYPNFYYSLLNGQRWQGSGATWSKGTHPCGGNTIQTLTAGITTRLALPSVTVEQVQPLAESFYLCAWVKLADVSLRPQTIFAKHDTSTTERSILFRVNSDGGALILVNKVGDGPNNIPLNSPGGYIADNTWAFVEGWRDTANETLNLAINRTEFSMALSNGSLHDSAADGALFKQEDNADAFDVGELFGFAMIIGAIPSAENRDWIYNSGVGRTLEDWQRRQLRTPIIEVTGGGSAGTPAFASIN